MHSSARPVSRRALAATLAVVAAAAVAALAPGIASADVALTGTVGPGFSISLVDASGAPVTVLDRGSYTITVHDRSDMHDFHLSGPGVDQFTEVEFVGDVTWTVTLQDGRYTFVCDPHSSVMHGSVTVGDMQVPATTATTTAAPTTAAATTTTAAAPAATTTAANAPAASKPAAKKPVVKKPAAKKPVVKKPVAKKPVVKKPASK
jgi:plastocyanin